MRHGRARTQARSARRTKGARWSAAPSTSRTIAAYALSADGRVTTRSNASAAFAVPPRISPPGRTVTGSGSPVSAEVSMTASAPSDIMPSVGTTSPARTTTTSSSTSSSTATSSTSAPRRRCAMRGRAFDEKTQLKVGAGVGGGLEGVAAGEHEGDDHGGEELADQERRGVCEERDRVGPDVTPGRGCAPPTRQAVRERRRCVGPDDVCRRVGAEHVEHRAGDEPAEDDEHDRELGRELQVGRGVTGRRAGGARNDVRRHGRCRVSARRASAPALNRRCSELRTPAPRRESGVFPRCARGVPTVAFIGGWLLRHRPCRW